MECDNTIPAPRWRGLAVSLLSSGLVALAALVAACVLAAAWSWSFARTGAYPPQNVLVERAYLAVPLAGGMLAVAAGRRSATVWAAALLTFAWLVAAPAGFVVWQAGALPEGAPIGAATGWLHQVFAHTPAHLPGRGWVAALLAGIIAGALIPWRHRSAKP